MTKSLRLLFLSIFVCCFSTRVFPQLQPPHFSRIDKSKGTETSFPMDIVMDKDYRYWIATFNGLMEYNGSGFRNYQMPANQNGSLGSAYLYRLFFENDSLLWIAHGGGVATFNIYRKQFDLVPIPHLPATTALNFIESFKDSEGRLFFVSVQEGLLYFDRNKKVIKPWRELDKEKTGFIFKVSESTDKKFYLLHTQKGLLVFDKKQKLLASEKTCPAAYRWAFNPAFRRPINDFATIGEYRYISLQDSASRLYIVIKYNERTGEQTQLPAKSNKGRLFFVDSFKKLWIYGFGGKDEAYLHDPVKNISYQLPDKEINSSEVDFSLCYRIVEDHENNIWLCTNTGILTYNPRQSNYTVIGKELPRNIYSYVEQIDSSHIWFGTLYNGIYDYNARTREFKNYDFSKATRDNAFNNIWQIISARDGRTVWVLHEEGRVTRFDVGQQKFYHYKDSVFGEDGFSFSDDDEGNQFFVTNSGKIISYDEQHDAFRPLLNVGELKGLEGDVTVSDLVAVGNKTLVMSTIGQGLIRLDLNSGRYSQIRVAPDDPNSMRSNMVLMMKKLDNAHIYAGTTNGIISYDFLTDSIQNYNYSDRFNLGFVYQLDRAKNPDYLYFVGTSKLYMLNWKTKDIIDLGRRANIERANFTEIYYSRNFDRLYVTSEESIYEVRVNQSEFNPDLKPVLYSLESYDRVFYIRNDGEITLDKGLNSFRLSFGASTYRYKDDLEFYYDFDNSGWIPALSNEIAFSNLRGGDHRFRLKLVYKGNRSITHETALTIHLNKKFHETAAFYLLIGLLVLAIFYAAYRIRIRRLMAVEKVRFQLSRDLHDDMGSVLSTINILSTMATSRMEDEPGTARNYLEKITDNSQVMMESMDDIVWSINPANDTISKVQNRMREFANNILEPKGIELIFVTDPSIETMALNMALRRDFFLIFKEAVNNAAKYSGCTRVKIELAISNRELLLTIMDNGKGFDVNQVTDGNGLVNMKNRAQKMKAQFKVESSPGEGTRITLKMNLSIL